MPSFLRSVLCASSPTSNAVADVDQKTSSTPPSPPSLPPIPVRSTSTPLRNGQPCTPLCLRCPKCQTATVNWTKFNSHLASCAEGRPISCSLYWCSTCSMVSTEKGLLEEHVLSEHDSKVRYIGSRYRCLSEP